MRTGISFQVIELSMNNFCKLRCVGCGSLDETSPHKLELNFPLVFQKIKNYSTDRIVLCGNSGEPLEHSMINEVLLELSTHFKEAKIQVSTNGENLFQKIKLETLRKISKNTLFQISLDGPNQKIHELTRAGGTFVIVMDTLSSLLKHEIPFEVVYTRHQGNEDFASLTASLVYDLFGIKLLFRDTTIISKGVHPPSQLSKRGNVSILYDKVSTNEKIDYTPNFKYLYIDHTGNCYPCVSFTKYKTSLKPPNIYDENNWTIFTRLFLNFQQNFCSKYQKEGDRRQCVLNCGIYNNFEFDNISTLIQKDFL